MKKRFLMLFMMLLLSALVVTAAGYAWFTASAQSQIQGTRVRAETQGVLKVWTPNNGGLSNDYSTYTTNINFADGPFKNLAYTDYAMKDQSGNGSLFYQTVSDGLVDKYGEVSGKGIALVYDLYFSAYTGNSNAPEELWRDIYLADLTVEDGSPDKDLANSIRIGFVANNNTIFGIANPHSNHDKFVTETDYAGGNGTPPTASGRIVSSSDALNWPTTGAASPQSELLYIPGAASDSTTVRKITAGEDGTTICHIDARVLAPIAPTLKVVIWIEGSDSNTTDAKISGAVNINMIFQARVASTAYSLITNPDGGAHDNPAVINGFTTPYWTTQAAADAGIAEGETYKTDGFLLPAGSKAGFTFNGWRITGFSGTELTKVYVSGGIRWLLRSTDFPANRTLTVYANWQ